MLLLSSPCASSLRRIFPLGATIVLATMSSPSPSRPSHLRRPSLLSNDESHNPLGTRSGHLQSLIRSRSTQSMQSVANSLHSHNSHHSHPSTPFWMGPDDEETALLHVRPHDNDELGRLLSDERRLTQLLNGPQNRSAKLIGRSNPRYRWEQYWKPEEELASMSKPL